jgi:hypothetical protein
VSPVPRDGLPIARPLRTLLFELLIEPSTPKVTCTDRFVRALTVRTRSPASGASPVRAPREHLHVPEPHSVVVAQPDVAGHHTEITPDPYFRLTDDDPRGVAGSPSERYEVVSVLVRERRPAAPPDEIVTQDT